MEYEKGKKFNFYHCLPLSVVIKAYRLLNIYKVNIMIYPYDNKSRTLSSRFDVHKLQA